MTLNVGLIGLGPEWEQRYRPALARLAPRLSVRCVQASILSQAEQAAEAIGCDVAYGLVSLIERDDVRALLVLDTAWYGSLPARLACRVGKPAFLASRLAHCVREADQLVHQAAQTGVTLMPDFAHRYTPATARLRELMATRLGKPQTLVIDVATDCNPRIAGSELPDAARDVLAVALDWSITLVGGLPVTVCAVRNGSSGERLELHVEFRRQTAGSVAPTAQIRLSAKSPVASAGPSGNGSDSSISLRARVECVHGAALLEGLQELTWISGAGNSGGERFVESLASDRPGVEVMLDHFCRRVVGGLIPVPTLDDLCRAFQLVDKAIGIQPRMI